MKIIKLIVFFIPILLFSCKKDPPIEPETAEPVMPPLTHQGLNTFGCYIEFPSADASDEDTRELYVANDGDNYWDIPAVSGGYDEESKSLNVQSARYINTEESDDIIILSDISDGIGTYVFRYNDDGGTPGYRNWYGDKCDYYFREYPDFDMGQLTITYLNEDENIIAGKFYINLVNENCEGDTILKITEGRFDFHY